MIKERRLAIETVECVDTIEDKDEYSNDVSEPSHTDQYKMSTIYKDGKSYMLSSPLVQNRVQGSVQNPVIASERAHGVGVWPSIVPAGQRPIVLVPHTQIIQVPICLGYASLVFQISPSVTTVDTAAAGPHNGGQDDGDHC